jgi:hypothetical protein
MRASREVRQLERIPRLNRQRSWSVTVNFMGKGGRV